MKSALVLTIILICLLPSILAATIKGTVYNSDLLAEKDVLIEINTLPPQKLLAKEGTYSFDMPPGKYRLSARKEEIVITEEVTIVKEGVFVVDLFLIPDFEDEEQLWQETEEELLTEEESAFNEGINIKKVISYILLGIIFLIVIIRIVLARRKYGTLRLFRKRIQAEQHKTVEQHQAELQKEPQHIEKTLRIIQEHEGRISQKELRKEMLYLSEAKISLILTELEHQGKIEKIKKGRGNVILLKQ